MRALILILVLLTGCGRQAGVEVQDFWVREAPPGTDVNAGYFQLHNRGVEAIVLTGVESARFGRVEIHEVIIEGAQMRMNRIESLTVPAGEALVLKPGGKHLMLFRATSAPKAGEQIPFTLLFGKKRLDISADVRASS